MGKSAFLITLWVFVGLAYLVAFSQGEQQQLHAAEKPRSLALAVQTASTAPVAVAPAKPTAKPLRWSNANYLDRRHAQLQNLSIKYYVNGAPVDKPKLPVVKRGVSPHTTTKTNATVNATGKKITIARAKPPFPPQARPKLAQKVTDKTIYASIPEQAASNRGKALAYQRPAPERGKGGGIKAAPIAVKATPLAAPFAKVTTQPTQGITAPVTKRSSLKQGVPSQRGQAMLLARLYFQQQALDPDNKAILERVAQYGQQQNIDHFEVLSFPAPSSQSTTPEQVASARQRAFTVGNALAAKGAQKENIVLKTIPNRRQALTDKHQIPGQGYVEIIGFK